MWFLLGYCHLRQDVRNFRLDRVEGVQLTTRTFERNLDVQRSYGISTRTLIARVRFSSAISRWVREDLNFYVAESVDTPDGLLVTLHIRHERDILRWLLGWGAHVQVLEPVSLRELLLQEAEAVLQNLRAAESLLP